MLQNQSSSWARMKSPFHTVIFWSTLAFSSPPFLSQATLYCFCCHYDKVGSSLKLLLETYISRNHDVSCAERCPIALKAHYIQYINSKVIQFALKLIMSEGSISIDFFYMGLRFQQYKRENANLKRTKLGLALILGTSLIANNNGIPSRLSKSFPEKAFIKGAGVSLTISSHTSLISLICLSSPPTISYVESGTFSTIIKLTRGST